MLAFRNIKPLTPVHVLVVPKKTIKSLQDAKDEVGSSTPAMAYLHSRTSPDLRTRTYSALC